MLRTLTISLALACIVAPVALAASEGAYVVRYVGTLAAGDATSCSGSSVGGTAMPVVIFGACGVQVTPGAIVRIDVVDDVRPPPQSFSYTLYTAGNALCGEPDHAAGWTEFVVPAGCVKMNVYVGHGATTGTIRVS